MKTALVVGSAGQDGTLLGEHLQRHGYRVVGIRRDNPIPITDAAAVDRFVSALQPHEIYFLAAFHHSSEEAVVDPGELFARSVAIHITALTHFLEAMRKHAAHARLFYAASSLIFGEVRESPQTEATPFSPTCAYGITKAAGVQICRHYRATHGMHASVGILYNHESPLRADRFLTKKVVKAAWQIKRGTREKLVVGNLAAEVDWGYAPDYVDAMRRIVALDTANDFVIGSGETHSVRELVELAFGQLGLDWTKHVEEDRGVLTRAPLTRVGDFSKLSRATGWRPMTSFAAMVQALVEAEGTTP